MNDERREPVAYTDKERIGRFLAFLPEAKVHDFVHLMKTCFPQYFGDFFQTYFRYRREVQESAVFVFTDAATQEAYTRFNDAADALYCFALALILRLDPANLDPDDFFYPDNYANTVLPEDPEEAQAGLNVLADTFQEAYDALLKVAVASGAAGRPTPKRSLAGTAIRFDDELHTVYIDDVPCRLPPFKNEHYLARFVFALRVGESIDWSEAYEALAGQKGHVKRTPAQQEQTVKDAVHAFNTRVKEVGATDDNFLEWSKKTLRRNF